MEERPFFIDSENHRLFAILHLPSSKPFFDEGFVFCAPFAEEKLWTHRVFVSFARTLCDLGYPVLRFDYMGHGDSTGNFEDTSIASRLTDIKNAIDTLKSETCGIRKINLLGLRLGALLAALTAENEKDIHRLILWEPISDGSKYIKELFRINMATQSAVFKEIRHNSDALIDSMQKGGSVNIDGYEIKWPLYEQLNSINFKSREIEFKGPVIAVQMNRKLGLGVRRIQILDSLYPNISLQEVEEQPFWKEIKEYYYEAPNLFNTTLEWLKTS
jgi:exosortase A-associated hydrolase 2